MPFRRWVPAIGLWALCVLDGGSSSVSICQARSYLPPQEEGVEQDDRQDGSTTVRIRGRLTAESTDISINFTDFELTLEEIVPAPELPLPKNFQEMTLEQRQKWFQDFQASEAGKRYQEQLAKVDAARRKRTTRADDEGKFSFNDGFSGTCGLFGQQEFSRDGKIYMADFFAEIPVGEGIRFLDLGELPLTVRRILKPGEAAPDLRLRPGTNSTEETLYKLEKFSGKPVFLCFWTRDSLPRIRQQLEAVLQKKPANLVVIGVNLDPPSAELQTFLSNESLGWTVLRTSGLESAPVAIDYGILAIPGFCLIDAQGKVVLNDDGFFEAFGQPNTTMETVISAALVEQ